MKYDYLENVKSDILDYVRENKEYLVGKSYEELYDEFFMADSITGNASGSYYCNTWKSEEALCHNMDLLYDALEEFGYEDVSVLEKGAEWCDVTIRCYMVGMALEDIYDDIEKILEEVL